jgi:hypothetical protein
VTIEPTVMSERLDALNVIGGVSRQDCVDRIAKLLADGWDFPTAAEATLSWWKSLVSAEALAGVRVAYERVGLSRLNATNGRPQDQAAAVTDPGGTGSDVRL